MKTNSAIAKTANPNKVAGRLRTACAAGLLLLLSASVVKADTIYQYGDFRYSIDGANATIRGYTGAGGEVTISDTINGLPVTSIGQQALEESPITSVVIPDSVTFVGDYAFMGCTKLTSVTIGNGVTYIGRSAFSYNYSLTSIVIPASVTIIQQYAFSDCTNLTGVYFKGNAPVGVLGCGTVFSGDSGYDPAIVYYLPAATGFGTNFWGLPTAIWTQSGTVTVTVTANPSQGGSVSGSGTYTIGSSQQISASANSGWWFQGWSNGTTNNPYSIMVPWANITYNAYFTDTKPQLSFTTANGAITITGYTGAGGAVTIPCTIIGLPVTSIGALAFYSYTSLTNVTIGNGVTNIGVEAFMECSSLTGVYFLGNAPSLGSYVFYGDTNATVYYLPGKTGWGTPGTLFGGRPTALWFLPNPLILNGPSFGVRTNQFGFIISWATNVPVVVEACTDLANPVWNPVATNTLTAGCCYFSDPQWTNYPGRFYRLRSP